MTACDPNGRDVVVKVAEPTVTCETPNRAVPAEKVTAPVGTPFSDTGFTWAVKTVGVPSTGIVEFTDRTVVVAARAVCKTGEERFDRLQPAIPINAGSIKTGSLFRQSDSRLRRWLCLCIVNGNNPG
jgi:hypothetical protein